MGKELDPDRLARMLPTVIPDSCLAGPGMIEKWMEMVIITFRRVRLTYTPIARFENYL